VVYAYQRQLGVNVRAFLCVQIILECCLAAAICLACEETSFKINFDSQFHLKINVNC
jgi:hypothetical protein